MADATEDDLYAALDWLSACHDRIQKKLAARHLKENALVLYVLSLSYFEGSHCPLAKLGHSRDGKRRTLQANYGLLTDERGCPVAVSVHEGNIADSTTFMPRSASIRTLVEQGRAQMGLFDKRNLLEISSPDFPGERLVACRNPELARMRSHTRDDLLAATENNFEKIKVRVAAAKLVGQDKIGVAAGQVVNQYKIAKHFELESIFQFRSLLSGQKSNKINWLERCVGWLCKSSACKAHETWVFSKTDTDKICKQV